MTEYTPPGAPYNAVNFTVPDTYTPAEYDQANFYAQGVPIEYTFDGYVQLNSSPVARTVYLHDRATGDLLASVVSDASTGYFQFTTLVSGTYFASILPILGEGYNILSYDNINLS